MEEYLYIKLLLNSCASLFCKILKQFQKVSLILTIAFCSAVCIHESKADSIFLKPTAAFGVRSWQGGDPYLLPFLSVKEGTSDRTCIEFNMIGQMPSAEKVYLNFYMQNMDDPNYSMISLFSYHGDGVAAASDYYNITDYIMSFCDYGEFVTEGWKPFSLDVTDVYNEKVQNGIDFIGFNLKAEDTVA